MSWGALCCSLEMEDLRINLSYVVLVRILVKVTFKPVEEIVIHDSVHHSLEDLKRLLSLSAELGGRTQPLLWAEGIAFFYAQMPSETSETVAEDQLEGKIHWVTVQWALMPQYKTQIEIEDIKAVIPVANVSANSSLCAVADALKKQTEPTTGQDKTKKEKR